MSSENVDIVRRAYAAWNEGRPETVIDLLDPQIEWHLPPNLPESGTWHGPDEIVRGLRGLSESWDELQAEVQEVLDAGDRVVALIRFQGRAAITGLDLEGAGVDAHLWTLRDGRAIDVRMYNGSRDALREAGINP
jgi:ketosteroid isomerase-like protein